MNAQQLLALVKRLLGDEEKFKIQQGFVDLNNAASQLAGSPQDPGTQTNFATRLTSTETAMSQIAHSYQPAEQKRLAEIGALRYFSDALLLEIRADLSQNQMTPAVVQQKIEKFVAKRSQFIANLEATRNSLRALKINEETVEEGTAEIGFQIPRLLFNNDLDGLIKELAVVRRIIRAFSELATGTVEPIEVHQISTSDPLFFFGLDPLTIAMLAGAVTWALGTWKSVEEIRKLRSETSKNKSFTPEEVDAFFSDKIKRTLSEAISEKTTALVEQSNGDPGRKEEQKIDLSWALESVLARVERGMTVEVRFLPPKTDKNPDDPVDPRSAAVAKTFDELSVISSQLRFPAPDTDPVLAIPPPKPAER